MSNKGCVDLKGPGLISDVLATEVLKIKLRILFGLHLHEKGNSHSSISMNSVAMDALTNIVKTLFFSGFSIFDIEFY